MTSPARSSLAGSTQPRLLSDDAILFSPQTLLNGSTVKARGTLVASPIIRQAAGKSWKREREERPFSPSALAFSES